MPTKAQPKVYQLPLKTHKLTIFLTATQSTTFASLKQEALSALLAQDVEGVPKAESLNDFEICRAKKEKGRNAGSTTGQYEVLKGVVKDAGLVNWEALFLQFRDEDGNVLPIESIQPSLYEEDEAPSAPSAPSLDTSPGANKGKRKAPPE